MLRTASISGGILMSIVDTRACCHAGFTENGWTLAHSQLESNTLECWSSGRTPTALQARRMLNHHRIQTSIRKEITSCLTFLAGFLASR